MASHLCEEEKSIAHRMGFALCALNLNNTTSMVLWTTSFALHLNLKGMKVEP